MPSCSASNCSSRSGGKGPKVSLFRFPFSDGERLRRWVAGVRRQDWRPTAGASLCALHFAEDCFLQAAGKRSLTPDAVPTIFTHSSTLAKTKYPINPRSRRCMLSDSSVTQLNPACTMQTTVTSGAPTPSHAATPTIKTTTPTPPAKPPVLNQRETSNGADNQTAGDVRISACWTVVMDSMLLQTNTIGSLPRFFHGGYCRPQSIHWAPDDQFYENCKDSGNLIKVKEPWEWLYLEVLGPLPVTQNKHKFIVTVTDLYSKWVEALPIQSCVSAQVTRHIVDIVKHFGYPLGILSRLPQDLVEQINMELRDPLSIPSSLLIFHQQTGTIDFTTQRAVDRMVSELVQQHSADWDVYLPAQVFRLCLKEHSKTKEKPFSLLCAKEVEPVRTPRLLNCTATIQRSVFVVN